MRAPKITVTHRDREKLRSLLDSVAGRDQSVVEALENELDRARVVPPEKVPPTVVTMNSRVVVEDDSGERQEVTLVYPRDADPSQRRISVLAPVGAAILGLTSGQRIEWPLPGGRTKGVRVVEVAWQPEAHGQYQL